MASVRKIQVDSPSMIDHEKTLILTQASTIQRMSQRIILVLAASINHDFYLRDINQAYYKQTVTDSWNPSCKEGFLVPEEILLSTDVWSRHHVIWIADSITQSIRLSLLISPRVSSSNIVKHASSKYISTRHLFCLAPFSLFTAKDEICSCCQWREVHLQSHPKALKVCVQNTYIFSCSIFT
jgi:hypothetical protein